MYHAIASDTPDLLAQWRWLLGGHPHLRGWSAAGDFFYADESGQIWRLDPGRGDAECVAESDATFVQLLADATAAEEILLLPVVREFEARHGPLGANQCLGFTTLPVFGGAYTADNRYALPVEEYAAVTGEVHRQIRDLPDGARVRFDVVP